MSRFVIDYTFELCLLYFVRVNFVGLGMLHGVQPAKSFARSLTRRLQTTGTRSVVANSNGE